MTTQEIANNLTQKEKENILKYTLITPIIAQMTASYFQALTDLRIKVSENQAAEEVHKINTSNTGRRERRQLLKMISETKKSEVNKHNAKASRMTTMLEQEMNLAETIGGKFEQIINELEPKVEKLILDMVEVN